MTAESEHFHSTLCNVLSQATELLKRHDAVQAFDILGPALTHVSQFGGGDHREQLGHARATAKAHEIFQIILQDPYSNRAYHKPRGYAGDAVMMDYVYVGVAPVGTSALGKIVFAGTTRGTMGLSVLFRRNLLTAYINEVATTRPGFRILSVASGHCRELEGSLLANPAFALRGEFVALDQDPESCELVGREYANYPIKIIHGSVKDLLNGTLSPPGTFDLVYSAGLFDYLDAATSSRLINTLAGLVRPRGKLLIGNFTPTSLGRGYMDLLLDWRLIYRSEEELLQLFGSSREPNLRSFLDPHGNVCYVEWVREA